MPDPAWPSSPPEINHARLVGPGTAGTAATTACAAAWQALACSNDVAFSLSSANTAATAVEFEGVGGLSSSTAANELNTALQALASWAQAKPPVVSSALAAYEAAVTSMIPAEVALANRAEQAADVALNPLVFGALTPAIVALDTEYFGEFWPHNASTGLAYGATLTALSAALAVPPPLSPPGSGVSAPLAAAATVAEEAGKTAAEEAVKQTAQAATSTRESAAPAAAVGELTAMMTQPIQAATSTLQPASGMFGLPMQSLQGMSGLLPALTGAVGAVEPEDIGAVDENVVLPGAVAAGSVPSSVTGGAGGGVAGGVGPAAPTGLTSYLRPSGPSAPEAGGRPVGLRTGLLSAAELHPLTSVGALPFSPATAGMLGGVKGADKPDKTALVRVVVPESRDPI